MRPLKADGIVVNPSDRVLMTSYCIVGKANEVVEVAAVSNAINTDNGQLTGMINSTDIRSLPIFSLNPIELATTLPGIQVISDSGCQRKARFSRQMEHVPAPTTF